MKGEGKRGKGGERELVRLYNNHLSNLGQGRQLQCAYFCDCYNGYVILVTDNGFSLYQVN